MFPLCLLAVAALWGCVPLNQHAALREAYDKLDSERQTYKQTLQAATNNANKLSAELKQAQQDVKELQARLQQTNQQMAELSSQLEAAKKSQATMEEARLKTAKEPVKESKPAKNGKPPAKNKKQ